MPFSAVGGDVALYLIGSNQVMCPCLTSHCGRKNVYSDWPGLSQMHIFEARVRSALLEAQDVRVEMLIVLITSYSPLW